MVMKGRNRKKTTRKLVRRQTEQQALLSKANDHD